MIMKQNHNLVTYFQTLQYYEHNFLTCNSDTEATLNRVFMDLAIVSLLTNINGCGYFTCAS